MNYIDAVNLLSCIESKFDVMSVRYRGVSIWPYLRCYIVDAIGYNKAKKPSMSNVTFILKSLFSYNPFVLFKRFDLWSYSGLITRKKIGDSFHHHVSGVLTHLNYDILYLENPEVSMPHYNKKLIPEKNIVSNSWSIFFSRGIEYMLRLFPHPIENVDILDEINRELGINFDYRFRTRLLYAQKLTTDFLLLLSHRPKVVVMECPYDQMGYVWSFHKHSIPVVELQHGVINEKHYAYNSKYNAGILSPDVLCVYGEEEYSYFKRKKTSYCKEIVKTGLYILDLADSFFKQDIFEDDRSKYESIIVVAGQTGMEEQLFDFITKAAALNQKYLYIYIPRRHCTLINESVNVRVLYDVNIYNYLKWCDVHCTLSSTTCLEAQFFGKPNIFVHLNDTAKEYYGNILSENNGSFFVDNPLEFVHMIQYCTNYKAFHYRNLFEKGNIELVENIVNRIISEKYSANLIVEQ